jgi:outer membrane protein assembly factor BamB
MPDGPRRLPLVALGALGALIALMLAGIYIYREIGALTVSASTPVILFTDPGNSNQIDGLTWDGQRAGKVTEIPSPFQSVCQTTGTTDVCSSPPVGGGAPPLNSAESSNPDGSLFVAFPYFYDRSGRVVATLKGGPYSDPGVGEYFVGTWADDNHQYCQVQPRFGGATAVTGTLQLTTPGGTPRDVVRIGSQAASEYSLTVGACSVLADRAVMVQHTPTLGSGGNTIDQYWVVELSSGHVLWTHDLRGAGVARVISSRDGRYVAEVPTRGASTIYGPSGSVVGHVSGLVEAFSWDGSLTLVVSNGAATVVRWSDGTVVWTVPAREGVSGFQPEPGGSSFAIRTVNGALYIVSAAGRVIAQRDVPGLLGCIPAQAGACFQ